MKRMTMSALTSIWCFVRRMRKRPFHDSSFTSDAAVQSFISSSDHVSAENFSVYSLYACFILGDKIFLLSSLTRGVHLFNGNRINSEFLMQLI